MNQPKIRINERTKIDRSVEIEARPHPRSDIVDHLLVEDLIEFGKALEQAEAPKNESVAVVLEKNSGRMRLLRVDWSEDLINGQPAPQVMEGKAP